MSNWTELVGEDVTIARGARQLVNGLSFRVARGGVAEAPFDETARRRVKFGMSA